ncbi:MAG: hypothetical protein ABJF10_03145 [Chthoniobacter sp.]|uniref:hypothetical protein n=1 Tax=Chthoniobacter sp. TaxID=2510640 RepID=UPI0032A7773F
MSLGAQRLIIKLSRDPADPENVILSLVPPIERQAGNKPGGFKPVTIRHPDSLLPPADDFWEELREANVDNRFYSFAEEDRRCKSLGRRLFEVLFDQTVAGDAKVDYDKIYDEVQGLAHTWDQHRSADREDASIKSLGWRPRVMLQISDEIGELWRYPWELMWIPFQPTKVGKIPGGIFLSRTYAFLRIMPGTRKEGEMRATPIHLVCGSKAQNNISATHSSPLDSICGGRRHRPPTLSWLDAHSCSSLRDMLVRNSSEGYVHLGHSDFVTDEKEVSRSPRQVFFLEEESTAPADTLPFSNSARRVPAAEFATALDEAVKLKSVYLLGSMTARVHPTKLGDTLLGHIPRHIVEIVGFQHDVSSASCLELLQILFFSIPQPVEIHEREPIETEVAMLHARRKMAGLRITGRYSERRRIPNEWWKPVIYRRAANAEIQIDYQYPSPVGTVESRDISIPIRLPSDPRMNIGGISRFVQDIADRATTSSL